MVRPRDGRRVGERDGRRVRGEIGMEGVWDKETRDGGTRDAWKDGGREE